MNKETVDSILNSWNIRFSDPEPDYKGFVELIADEQVCAVCSKCARHVEWHVSFVVKHLDQHSFCSFTCWRAAKSVQQQRASTYMTITV